MRKLIAILALGAIVTLSGCSALPFIDESDNTNTGVDIEDPSEQIPGEEQTVEEFRQTHADALNEAGSYTTQFSVAIDRGEQSQESEYQYKIGSDGDPAFSSVSQFGTTISQYTSGDTTYIQQSSGEQKNYRIASAPYNGQIQPVNVSQAPVKEVLFPFEKVPHNLAETKSYNGVEVGVYEMNEDEGIEKLEEAVGENATVESFSSTMYMDGAGIVRYQNLSYSISANNQSIESSLEMTVTNVGGTTVEEPDWVETAEEQTQSDG